MIAEMRTAFERCRDTLVQDAIGAAALVVMLMVGLNLPGVF